MLDNNAQRKDFKGWAKKQLDLETYISIVDDLKELGGCEWISMCGCGEPFIVKDIMKMIGIMMLRSPLDFCILSKQETSSKWVVVKMLKRG